MKQKILTTAVIAALGMGVSSAHAALALEPLFADAPLPTLLSDNSAEYWIDVDGDGKVSNGDILFGILSMGDINSVAIGAGTMYNELTVIQASKIFSTENTRTTFAQNVEIADFFAVALGAADSAYFNWATGEISLAGDGNVDYTFTNAFGATNDGKTFALAFEDANPDYTRDSTIQAGLTSTTNGDARLMITIDTDTDPGDTIFVTAPTDPDAAFATIGSAATSIAGTSIFIDGTVAAQSWPGLFFFDDFVGGTGGFGTPSVGTLDSEDPWAINNNIDFTVTAQRVPEPASLALLGIGLIGLCAVRRRKHA